MTIFRLLIRFVVGAVINGAFIIGPVWLMTRSLDWPRGWLAIATIFGTQLLGGIWLLKTDPELLRERATAPKAKTRADKFATTLIVSLIFGWFALTAIDVHRLHLLPVPAASISLWGELGLYAIGMSIIMWTFHENTFAAPVVKIQAERKQRVIDTGPYGFVRHPMYAGMILVFAGLGLIMESSAMALAALPMVVIGFLPRMIIEEATLRLELKGYDEYLSRVRSRLVPGIF